VEPSALDDLRRPPSVTYVTDEPGRKTTGDSKPAPKKEEPLEPETIQIDPETGKYLGRLKWYNPSRGYGFIARGGGEDIFFHKTDVNVDVESLDEGQWVLYDVEETKKGLEANDIDIYEGTPE
jgi:CspA family cold shock protein